MGLGGENPFDECVHAVGEGGTVLSDWAVHEAKVLEEHQLAVLVQSVERLVPRVLLQRIRYVFYVILSNCAGRSNALEVVEQVSVFQQQLLQTT